MVGVGGTGPSTVDPDLNLNKLSDTVSQKVDAVAGPTLCPCARVHMCVGVFVYVHVCEHVHEHVHVHVHVYVCPCPCLCPERSCTRT